MYHLGLQGMLVIAVVGIVIEKIVTVSKALHILEAKRQDFYLLKNIGKTAIAASAAGAVLLAFYLPLKKFLKALCLDFSHRAMVLINFEKGTDFFGGVLFLGICFIIYVPVYLFLANLFGAIASEDRENVISAFYKILGKAGLKSEKQKLKIVETLPASDN
jgi:hypothetical protein